MAKKDKDTIDTSSLTLFDLTQKLEGVSLLDDNQILNTRKKTRSRIEILNCLLGGGRPFGSITGSFGPPSGGKSTEAYESAAEFLLQEPTGVAIIIDQESSADPSRIKFLGVDTNRVLRVKVDSINSGFNQLIEIFKIIEARQNSDKTRVPAFVVWDTITKGRAEDDETASRMDARNRARVIKSRMNDVNPWLEKLDVILVLLNQVVLSSDMYGNVITNAGGGVGLKHDEHLRLYITKGKTVFDNDTGLAVTDFSSVNLDKTKLSPKVNNIPLVFDVLNGGRINEHYSFMMYFQERKLLVSSGGWWNIEPLIKQSEGKFYHDWLAATYTGNKRYEAWTEALTNDPAFYLVLRLFFMDFIGEKYALQKVVMQSYYDELYASLHELEPTLIRDVVSNATE